ncbi:MAG: hypothetical protein WAM91_04075 [Candidatus Acidiferrales bacterium]
MNNHMVLSAAFLVAASLVFAPRSQAQDCNFPPKDLTQGERREYKNLYENRAYGYSIVIPTNLVGYDDVNPLYQHGFGIALGAEPKSYIFVDGEPNSLEFASPSDAASRFLKYLRRDGSTVQSSKITESKLGTLRAAFLVATYTCPGSTERYVRASMVAISPDKSNLYEVTLFAHSDRFEQDRAVLDALVKSWKHLGK